MLVFVRLVKKCCNMNHFDWQACDSSVKIAFRLCGESVLFFEGQKKKLDDGWPEGVEEQGLLLLVLRHYITRQYI